MSALTVSALRSSSNTPIRATTSNLSLRAAPPVPPANQNYEPLAKAVLQKRLISTLFPYSAAFAWVASVISLVSVQGGVAELGFMGTLLQPLRPSTLALTALSWGLSAVPVVVVRKRYSSASPTAATSPSQIFHTAWSKPSTFHALVTYTGSALFLLLLHVITSYAFESDPRLSLFVKSKKHPYYLNGRLLYLLSSQLFVAFIYLLRNVLLDRFSVRWSSSNRNPETQNFRLARIIAISITLTLLALLNTSVHLVLFGLTRSIALPVIFHLPIIPKLLRPFTAHFLRGPYLFTLFWRNLGLGWKAFCLGLKTIAIWEVVEEMFDNVVAEPIAVASMTADPALSIISGTTSSDIYFTHLAYDELAQLAKDSSNAATAKRSALFADQKYNPSMWNTLTREALVTLGKDYQLLLRRGQPEAAVSGPAPPAKVSAPPSSIKPAPLLRQSVLKPSSQSPIRSAIDTLASDGTLGAAAAEAVPELFRSVLHAPPPTESEVVKRSEEELSKIVTNVTEETKAWKGKLVELVERNLNLAPRWVCEVREKARGWWVRERVNKVVEGALPNRKLDALVVEALSHLVCFSLTEDKYGIVQRDIPRILEAMISFLIALEQYQTELQTKYPTPTPDELAVMNPKERAEKAEVIVELERAFDVLNEVHGALKDGLVRIVQTFAERLEAFKFPPRIAKRLQNYVDYT